MNRLDPHLGFDEPSAEWFPLVRKALRFNRVEVFAGGDLLPDEIGCAN
jgi:hypothetical protein